MAVRVHVNGRTTTYSPTAADMEKRELRGLTRVSCRADGVCYTDYTWQSGPQALLGDDPEPMLTVFVAPIKRKKEKKRKTRVLPAESASLAMTIVQGVAAVLTAAAGGVAIKSDCCKRTDRAEPEAEPAEEPAVQEPAAAAEEPAVGPAVQAQGYVGRDGPWQQPQFSQRERLLHRTRMFPCLVCGSLDRTTAGSNNHLIQIKCAGCGTRLIREQVVRTRMD